MENLNSLLAHLLRAKYYSGSNFMEASLGVNPSFVWKSIDSVNSGYKMLLDAPTVNLHEQELFKQIWSLERLTTDNKCSRCGQSCESSTHAVQDCLPTTQSSTVNLKHAQEKALVRWMPPPQRWVKVNVNAWLPVAKKRAVLGFIIKNDEGFIMGSGIQEHNLVHSVVTVEAIVVLHGLNLPWIWFIAREGNGAAHAMVVEGMRTEGDSFWVEDAPLKALEVVDSNRQCSRPP
ncbi:hypothetical protein J1N35_019376 [Gossypium stocksii]|uniref:RNase H type-1 domain-containing protein n=1 Tax=Gossypium stocksii TaxID=47602 RepID=A0A9D3VR77_9ROSI|nr:hypothetical protein J1N35_019376 [Gossypium stocksii]